VAEFSVTFKPAGIKVIVPQGTDLLTAAFKGGIPLNAVCGGEGLCGKCRVVVTKGKVSGEASSLINDEDRAKGVVLACESIVESDLEILIPQESAGNFEVSGKRRADAEEFLSVGPLEKESALKRDPLVTKIFLEIKKPSDDDGLTDLERVDRELKKRSDPVFITTAISNAKHLGAVLRESGYKVTAVIGHKESSSEIILFEPGDTTDLNYGFAFDIGTTTVTGQLIDLNSGRIIGTRIAYNRQSSYGSDVISRIIYGSDAAGLLKLCESVLSNINEMVEDLATSNSIPLSSIYSAVIAGNMTMMHLLLKSDPSDIRKEPYMPAITAFPPMSAGKAGIKINPKGMISFLPGVSSYVGGDTVAGVLSCGLFDGDELSLLVDIGTNGEIVLGNREWMISCSASAGPSFEGSGLQFGMKAVKGAVQKVVIAENLDLKYETISGDKPKGICGSGYIDLLEQMFRRSLMEKNGKINRSKKTDRIRKTSEGCEYIVAFKDETSIGRDITIDENDIENLKRSKGAIYSAILALLNKMDKRMAEVNRVYIAGGFGNYLDIENAISIGLLPDVPRKIYKFIGNSALAGARMCLASREAFSKALKISQGITYLDLSSEPGYMDEYIAALFFPHTDIGRFPSVR